MLWGAVFFLDEKNAVFDCVRVISLTYFNISRMIHLQCSPVDCFYELFRLLLLKKQSLKRPSIQRHNFRIMENHAIGLYKKLIAENKPHSLFIEKSNYRL